MEISSYKHGQEIEIHHLIKKVYDEFVAPDYSMAGNQVFYDWIAPEQILERQTKVKSLWIATDENKLVGMIEIRENNRISLLFVDKNFQEKGIAKALLQIALERSLEKEPELQKYLVHASPYSIPIYKKLGFEETDSIQETMGIIYLPMEMKIKK
jgi:GNAT superfamily N-acetyltransferase